MNCLGKLLRETGQSRVPDPPQRMTGVMSVDVMAFPLLPRGLGYTEELGQPDGRTQGLKGCERFRVAKERGPQSVASASTASAIG